MQSMKGRRSGKPGVIDDAILKESKLRGAPASEKQVSLCRPHGLALAQRCPAPVQVLDDAENWRDLHCKQGCYK